MAEEPRTLINRLRDALALHPENLSKFLATLTAEEQQDIRQMIILVEELAQRGLITLAVSTARLSNFKDPVDELRAAFSDLVFTAQMRLTTLGKEEIFGRWLDILTQKLRSRKDVVMLRWVTMSPTMSKYKFTRMIAKENEAFPPNEQEGWTSTDPELIKVLINRELRELRAQEEPPHLSVIEGGRKTP